MEGLYGRAGPFVEVFRLRGLTPQERARAAWARLREAKDEGVALDETTLMSFRQAVERATERFRERADDLDRLETLETLVSIVREAGLAALPGAGSRPQPAMHSWR